MYYTELNSGVDHLQGLSIKLFSLVVLVPFYVILQSDNNN